MLVTPKDAKAARIIQDEITGLQARADLTVECMQDHQSSVIALVTQKAADILVEEHRDKATAYYESFLDISIQIGRLTRKLTDLTK